jgi:DtxR family Mn-dependent transcriptional regulator
MATISKENYLKSIYNISQQNGDVVPISALAKELEVSKSAVSEMANKLAAQKFIEYEKYKGVKILAKGKKLALNVIRKHRLWEIFLIETLNLNWNEVHIEAERLEHSTSDYLINKIDEHLQFPEIDPHGDPIPNKDGVFRSNISTIPMEECIVGHSYIIARVNDKNSELMNYLSKINVILNKKILIVDKLGFDKSIIITVDGINHSLSEIIINNIFLSECE